MLSCWQQSTRERPSFETLQNKFEQMLLSASDNEYIDFSINPEMSCYDEELGDDVSADEISSIPKDSDDQVSNAASISCNN